jgi:hypothetical protein
MVSHYHTTRFFFQPVKLLLHICFGKRCFFGGELGIIQLVQNFEVWKISTLVHLLLSSWAQPIWSLENLELENLELESGHVMDATVLQALVS